MAIKHLVRDMSGKLVERSLTPLTAITVFCKECVCWVDSEVRNCASLFCPLHPFRRGRGHSGRPPPGGQIRLKFGRSDLSEYQGKEGDELILDSPIAG